MLSREKLWMSYKDYVIIVLGLACYAFGFSAFVLPEKIVIRRSGRSKTLVYFHGGIPVAITSYVLNLLLLAMAYRVVGKQFVLRTVFSATVLNGLIGILQPLFPRAADSPADIHEYCYRRGSLRCGVGRSGVLPQRKYRRHGYRGCHGVYNNDVSIGRV